MSVGRAGVREQWTGALGSIPAAIHGVLGMEQLYLVAFFASALDLIFDVAAVSIVPTVRRRTKLTEGNTLLNLNGQVAKLAGKPLAGFLIAAFTAPLVIALDAASYVVSALCIAAISLPELPTGCTGRLVGRDQGGDRLRVAGPGLALHRRGVGAGRARRRRPSVGAPVVPGAAVGVVAGDHRRRPGGQDQRNNN